MARSDRWLLRPRTRKVWLLAHVIVSVGWLGGGAANAALAFHALGRPGDPLSAPDTHRAIDVIDSGAVIPAAFAALATGLIVSLGTKWGLFVHWWVVAKLILTIAVIIASTVGIGLWIEQSVTSGDPALASGRTPAILTLAIANLVVFVVMTALSIYKPRGTLRRGGPRRGNRAPSPGARTTAP